MQEAIQTLFYTKTVHRLAYVGGVIRQATPVCRADTDNYGGGTRARRFRFRSNHIALRLQLGQMYGTTTTIMFSGLHIRFKLI